MSHDTVADDLLRSGYQRWLRLEEEKTAIADDLKELFAELKANGLDTKALRVSFRRVRDADSAEVAEQEALVNLYVASLTRDTRVRARENIEEFGADVVLTDHIDGDGNRLVVTVDSRVAAILNRVEPKLDTPEHDAETGEIIETDGQFSAGVQIMRDRAGRHDAPVGELEIISNSAPAEDVRLEDGLGPSKEGGATSAATDDVASTSVPSADPDGGGSNSPDLTADAGNMVEATETLDDLAVQDGVKMSSDGSGDLTTGRTPTWPLTPADDGQVASNSHADLTDKAGAEQSTPAPLARLKTTDEVADDMGLPLDPHPSCRKPKICGRFSHKSLCAICRGEQAQAA